MRASFFILSVAIAALAIAVSSSYAASVCDSQTTCSACMNVTAQCGWCSDWNGCMPGGRSGPFSGSCKSWSYSTCVGVSIPVSRSCSGNPITQNRLRQLMGGAGTRANLTTSGQFKYQSRRCSSITGCTNWAFSDVSTPTVDVELAIFGDTAYVSFITGRCDKPSSGCTSSDAIPVYGANYARYGFSAKVDFSSTSLALSRSRGGVPVVSCSSTYCNSNPWHSSIFDWKAQLTNDCFHLVTVTNTNNPDSPSDTEFLELYGTF